MCMQYVLCPKCLYVLSVPPEIYSFAGVTEEEGQPSSLVCMSHGDPSPDLTFHKTGHTDIVYRYGSKVCICKYTLIYCCIYR